MPSKEEIIRIRIDTEMLALYNYLCEKEHASNVSAMTRKLIADWVNDEVREILQDMGLIYLSSAELEQVLPEVYEALLEKLTEWAGDPTNTASEEDVEAFRAGQYTIEILFGDDEIAYTAGRDGQEIANQPPWATDKWSDFLEVATKDWLIKLIK